MFILCAMWLLLISVYKTCDILTFTSCLKCQNDDEVYCFIIVVYVTGLGNAAYLEVTSCVCSCVCVSVINTMSPADNNTLVRCLCGLSGGAVFRPASQLKVILGLIFKTGRLIMSLKKGYARYVL